MDLPGILITLIDLTRCQRFFDFPVVPARTVTLACEMITLLCEKVSLTSWHLLFNGDLAMLIQCLTVKLAVRGFRLYYLIRLTHLIFLLLLF